VFFRGEIFRVFPRHHSVSPRRVCSRESEAESGQADSAAIVLES